MREGRIGQVWAATAAAVLGVLVASVAGGYLPSWWLLVPLALIPVAATIAISRRRRRMHVRRLEPDRDVRETTSRRSPAPRLRRRSRGEAPRGADVLLPLDPGERDVVERVDAVFDRYRVHWLRTCDFESPWLHQNMEPLFALLPALPRPSNAFVPADGLALTALPLAEAIERLAAFYSANTLPDPLLVGDDWRFCRDSADLSTKQRGTAPDAEMRALARAVVDAYEAFRSAMAPRRMLAVRTNVSRRRAG